MAKPVVHLDKSRLERIARNMGKNADDLVGELAFTCQREIVDNFSRTSPSPEFEPPGIVTGTLKNSIKAAPVKHLMWRVYDQTDYGIHLEYGTRHMRPRPFFLPAVRRTAVIAQRQGLLKKVIEA